MIVFPNAAADAELDSSAHTMTAPLFYCAFWLPLVVERIRRVVLP